MERNKKARVASLQYFIRPVKTYDDFVEQVSGLVATAADYKVDLLVFPEYFTLQLLTLGDQQEEISHQIKSLASYKNEITTLFASLSKKHGLYIVGGSLPVLDQELDRLNNNSYFFGPGGDFSVQSKLHMTRFEKEEWFVSAGKGLKIFDTRIGKIAINICYDVEFPELARSAAKAGANILVVPSCTDDRQGYLRVRYCAHARAIENQMYVIHSVTVGSLPMIPAVSLNYGQASILTPSDFEFARDGIRAEGIPNQESMVIADLDLLSLEESRHKGTVLPLTDSADSIDFASKVECEIL